MYIINQKEVHKRLDLKKASLTNLSVSMGSKGRPFRLFKFKTRANKSPGKKGAPPAFAQVKRSSGGGRIPGAFMANFKAGAGNNKGVFVRTGTFRKKRRGIHAGKIRENIRQLHAPGTAQMLNNQQIRIFIQNHGIKRFNKALDHEVKHLLRVGK